MSVGIIATFGPSLNTTEALRNIIKEGTNIIRFNFSHADRDVFDKILNDLENLKKDGYKIKTLADLQGNRIRVRNIDNQIEIKNDAVLKITNLNIKSSKSTISIDYPYTLSQVKKGNRIYIDDGNIELECIKEGDKEIDVYVKRGGIIKNRKGVNLPDTNLYFPTVNQQDINDLKYILNKNFDMIALSFVRNSNEISVIRKYIKDEKPKKYPIIISKIENKWAIKNLNSIIENSDGVMVARGDLGISLPLYKIPFFQKKIIKQAKEKSKFSIVATQIFESMVEHYRPTRAEISDLANAIEDGCDYILFSAETAIGKYPIDTIRIAKSIIRYSLRYLKNES
jgi:pyruvate kinase